MANNIIKGDLLSLQTQRKFAKIGTGVALGVTALTAFGMKNSAIKRLHIVAGAALVGFSIYHYGLYNDGFFQKLLNQRAKKLKSAKPENLVQTTQNLQKPKRRPRSKA